MGRRALQLSTSLATNICQPLLTKLSDVLKKFTVTVDERSSGNCLHCEHRLGYETRWQHQKLEEAMVCASVKRMPPVFH